MSKDKRETARMIVRLVEAGSRFIEAVAKLVDAISRWLVQRPHRANTQSFSGPKYSPVLLLPYPISRACSTPLQLPTLPDTHIEANKTAV